jgi:hypothetical protein
MVLWSMNRKCYCACVNVYEVDGIYILGQILLFICAFVLMLYHAPSPTGTSVVYMIRYKYPVNGGNATMGGSRVQYIDFARDGMAEYMDSSNPSSSFVMDFGIMIEHAYNVKGEPIGPRNEDDDEYSLTTYGAHYGNTDADGKYTVKNLPREADWFFQSFCSAHLEEHHQWGKGLGFEDDIFMTNEEWNVYFPGEMFVGIGVSILCVIGNARSYSVW